MFHAEIRYGTENLKSEFSEDSWKILHKILILNILLLMKPSYVLQNDSF